ncbi:MAG TPA: DUF309 domain-containing protein [Chroococcales cyanobacterium]
MSGHQPNQPLPEPPAGFALGIDEFNRGEFFQCHETLEAVWNEQRTDEGGQLPRELTQGIIQIAVAYYHFLRDNHVGALKLLKRGLERIDRVAQKHPFAYGLDLQKLSREVSNTITEIGQPQAAGFKNPVRIPQIEYLAD